MPLLDLQTEVCFYGLDLIVIMLEVRTVVNVALMMTFCHLNIYCVIKFHRHFNQAVGMMFYCAAFS